ncbi:hypothetical protein CWC18_16010 [Pseudoalteromonas aurantia]|uniref:Uncharacterized protein n=1 Tax=Pseudoalteromonas aurantia TaxID=43654 RepID=A0A5S3V2U2_9GAMM|nr:hypothetical protein [Pseudoalteromonas aurantia]TMO59365.1 hypothetical protein CWC18_16010 [Pseudoalteromonas aurantia]TMO65012.1 hypothetical protein CWC19_17895 [Pseudoalteromonas aurantia]
MDMLVLKTITGVLMLPLIFFILWRMVKWAKGMPKGAYIFIAFMPLISLFPIPPTVFKNVAKAKQEQRKKQTQSDE